MGRLIVEKKQWLRYYQFRRTENNNFKKAEFLIDHP
jgi:hypothetical protein